MPRALRRACGCARSFAGAIALFALCSALATAPALGAKSHGSPFAFGGKGLVAGEAGSLSLSSSRDGSGVAVSASHQVYVADTGNRRVDEFSVSGKSGKFVRAWGWGVASGAAELQVCTATCLQGLSGSQPGEFETPSYIAVDNSATSASKGDVYVADISDNLVTKFDGEGHLLSSWGNNGEKAAPNGQLNGSPTELFSEGNTRPMILGIAVDQTGDLRVYNEHEHLFTFEADGASVATCHAGLLAGPGPGGIATSGSNAYVHDGFGRIQAVEPSCVSGEAQITQDQVPELSAEGVDVDNSSGDFYVVRGGTLVEDIPGSCVPSANGCAPSQAFGEGVLDGASGLAVDQGSGLVLVANAGSDTLAAFEVVLEATVAAASNLSGHEALLHGAVNPEGVELSSCEFEIGKSTSYGSQIPCAQAPSAIGKGQSPVSVDATASALAGGGTYHFRLHARSPSGTVYSEDGVFTTSPTPIVREVSASAITADGVTLQAVVNPAGAAAKYHFEYGACAAPGDCVGSPFMTHVPEPDGELAAGSGDVPLSQHVELSLAPGATYHFRIVVNGETSPAPPEGTFVFEPSASSCATPRSPLDSSLPDCRAYEMVTPIEKNDALIDNGVLIEDPSIAADGSRVFSQTLQCFHDSQSCTAIRQTEGSPYSFARGDAGWETQSLLPSPGAYSTMLAYSASAGTVLLARSPEPTAQEQLVAREPDGTFRTIGPIAEASGQHIAAITTSPRVATAGLTRVLYEGSGLWPGLEGAASPVQVLAEPGPRSGQAMLVGVSGPAGSTDLIGACGTTLGGNKEIYSAYNSLSGDGRSMFFTVAPCKAGGTGSNAGVSVPAYTLYERVESPGGEMKSVLVSGPGPAGVCHAECLASQPRDASFQGASSDGSRVFFTDTGRLTDDAGQDGHGEDSAFSNPTCTGTSSLTSGCNLYAFTCPAHCENESERKLVDVSAGDSSGLGPRVQGVVAIAPDGSDVFFVAQGVLTGKANEMGLKPSPGGANLYVYRLGPDGGEGAVTFIATLPKSEVEKWGSGIVQANVTSDGRVLVFTSHRALSPDVSREEGPAQVYRYDVETERLSRVSIGQAGFDDNGNAPTADAKIVGAFHGFESGVGPARPDPTMSDDGSLVFFETPTGLTPGALNDHAVIGNPNVLAENVYEWAADGTQPSPNAPACAEPNGCISLISDGHDLNEGSHTHSNPSAVQLLGVDDSGENVFFTTADQLVRRDTDSQVDFYDARVGGGFPEAPPAPEPCATLDECRTAPPAEPLFSSPPSATFSGAGNLIASPPGTSVKPTKPPTRAQQLARALKACRTIRNKRKRAVCQARAQRRYGHKHKLKTTTRQSSRRSPK
jgi:hypothetical protein